MIIPRPPTISFGVVSAIVTSIGLIIGFGAAGLSKSTMIAGLFIVAFADNLTDSLSIHLYQESEKLEERAAFQATASNFVARLLVSLSFIAFVLVLSTATTLVVSLLWGGSVLTAISWLVAKHRRANIAAEIIKHLAVAAVVIASSQAIGIGTGILRAQIE